MLVRLAAQRLGRQLAVSVLVLPREAARMEQSPSHRDVTDLWDSNLDRGIFRTSCSASGVQCTTLACSGRSTSPLAASVIVAEPSARSAKVRPLIVRLT